MFVASIQRVQVKHQVESLRTHGACFRPQTRPFFRIFFGQHFLLPPRLLPHFRCLHTPHDDAQQVLPLHTPLSSNSTIADGLGEGFIEDDGDGEDRVGEDGVGEILGIGVVDAATGDIDGLGFGSSDGDEPYGAKSLLSKGSGVVLLNSFG